MQQRIKFMYKLFAREPLLFKVIIVASLLISIIFSSSYFSEGYYQSGAKLASAVFLGMLGIKMKRNTKISALLFIIAAISIYLAWESAGWQE